MPVDNADEVCRHRPARPWHSRLTVAQYLQIQILATRTARHCSIRDQRQGQIRDEIPQRLTCAAHTAQILRSSGGRDGLRPSSGSTPSNATRPLPRREPLPKGATNRHPNLGRTVTAPRERACANATPSHELVRTITGMHRVCSSHCSRSNKRSSSDRERSAP